MRPLIKTTFSYDTYDASMTPNGVQVSYRINIFFNVLAVRMTRMTPKSKFQTEEYKNTHIIGRIAPYIGFGRFAVIRVIREHNRLFFLNNWYDTDISSMSYRVHTCVIRAINSLKSRIFSNHWGCLA